MAYSRLEDVHPQTCTLLKGPRANLRGCRLRVYSCSALFYILNLGMLVKDGRSSLQLLGRSAQIHELRRVLPKGTAEPRGSKDRKEFSTVPAT